MHYDKPGGWSRVKKKLPGLGIGIMVISGLLIMSYPSISNWYNKKYQMEAILNYQEQVGNMKQEQMEKELEEAQKYNEALTGADIEDPFVPGSGTVLPENYMSILNMNEGIMGYVEVPEADIYLPIYHGTSERVLEIGAGHMEKTAFPIGEEGNHAVLTGHTALPTALLFTNLQDAELGQQFYIHIMDQVLAYEIDSILVVEPSDTSALKPVPGEDYVTLITCTPYAINSHRLLVRGTRTEYIPDEIDEAATRIKTKLPYNLIISVVVLIIVGIIVIYLFWQRKRRRF